MAEGLFEAKSILNAILAAEEAQAQRDQALADRDAAREETQGLQARQVALEQVIAELHGQLAELAQQVAPAERAAQEQAIGIRAEVQELTRQRESLQQILFHTRRQQSDADEQLQQRKCEILSLGSSAGGLKDQQITQYEATIEQMKMEIFRLRGEQVAAVIVEGPLPLPDPGATDAELLEQWKESPEGQRWTQAGGAHG